MGSTKVDLIVEQGLGGEGDTAVPAGEDLEWSVIGEADSRLDVCVVGEESL